MCVTEQFLKKSDVITVGVRCSIQRVKYTKPNLAQPYNRTAHPGKNAPIWRRSISSLGMWIVGFPQ
jgi:hypothetical protein